MSSNPPRGVLPLAAQQLAGGGTVSFACAVAGQGAVTAALREDKKIAAAVAGLAAIAVALTVNGTILFAAAVAGVAAIAVALKEDKRLAVLVAGGAQVAVGMRLQTVLRNVVSGQATVIANLTSGGGAGAAIVKDVDQTVHIVMLGS